MIELHALNGTPMFVRPSAIIALVTSIDATTQDMVKVYLASGAVLIVTESMNMIREKLSP